MSVKKLNALSSLDLFEARGHLSLPYRARRDGCCLSVTVMSLTSLLKNKKIDSRQRVGIAGRYFLVCRYFFKGGRCMRGMKFFISVSAMVFSLTFLAGCGTAPPKDFGGRWKPVNRFATAPTEIPLYSSYVFQASPTDRTLKKMLERWAADTGLVLDYRLPSDYTLFGPIAAISTTNAQQAASEVSSVFHAQGLLVSINGASVVVSSAVDGVSGEVEPEG